MNFKNYIAIIFVLFVATFSSCKKTKNDLEGNTKLKVYPFKGAVSVILSSDRYIYLETEQNTLLVLDKTGKIVLEKKFDVIFPILKDSVNTSFVNSIQKSNNLTHNSGSQKFQVVEKSGGGFVVFFFYETSALRDAIYVDKHIVYATTFLNNAISSTTKLERTNTRYGVKKQTINFFNPTEGGIYYQANFGGNNFRYFCKITSDFAAMAIDSSSGGDNYNIASNAFQSGNSYSFFANKTNDLSQTFYTLNSDTKQTTVNWNNYDFGVTIGKNFESGNNLISVSNLFSNSYSIPDKYLVISFDKNNPNTKQFIDTITDGFALLDNKNCMLQTSQNLFLVTRNDESRKSSLLSQPTREIRSSTLYKINVLNGNKIASKITLKDIDIFCLSKISDTRFLCLANKLSDKTKSTDLIVFYINDNGEIIQ